MYRKSALLTLSLSLAITTGCKSPEQKAAEDAAKNMQEATAKLAESSKNGTANVGDAMNALGAAMGAANNGKKVDVVDYKVLKDMLPGDLSGMKRSEATGEKNSAMGITIANAEGRYKNDDASQSMNIKITDIGSMTGLAGMAMYAWASTDIDRETETGYEKTSTFNGFKSHEKYDKSSKSGELSTIVGGRFVVEAQGSGVDMNAIKDAVSKVDLKKLDGMKNEGVH